MIPPKNLSRLEGPDQRAAGDRVCPAAETRVDAVDLKWAKKVSGSKCLGFSWVKKNSNIMTSTNQFAEWLSSDEIE